MKILPIAMLLVAFAGLLLPKLTKKLKLVFWKRSLHIKQHKTIFDRLYDDINGFLISQKARDSNGDAPEYLYGEIEFTSFIALLYQCKPNNQSIFYDLGSGTGKAVLSCAIVFDIKKSCGIELFKELHLTALNQRASLQNTSGYEAIANTIQFNNQNFLDSDFSDATIIFINATAYFGDTWSKLIKKLEKVNQGTYIITTSKRLKSELFFLEKMTTVSMSWGPVIAYIHKR